VQGALAVLDYDPKVITIFIDPGSMEQLEQRLRARGTESEDAIQRRLQVAREEMGLKNHYRHIVLNDRLDDAVTEVCRLLCQYDARVNQTSAGSNT